MLSSDVADALSLRLRSAFSLVVYSKIKTIINAKTVFMFYKMQTYFVSTVVYTMQLVYKKKITSLNTFQNHCKPAILFECVWGHADKSSNIS